ncbi:hypothetical protein [Paractinoplanes durhamensis]
MVSATSRADAGRYWRTPTNETGTTQPSNGWRARTADDDRDERHAHGLDARHTGKAEKGCAVGANPIRDENDGGAFATSATKCSPSGRMATPKGSTPFPSGRHCQFPDGGTD